MRNLKYYFSRRIKTTENYKHFLLKKYLCSLKNKNNSYGGKCTICYSDDSFWVNRCFKNIIEEYFLWYTGLSQKCIRTKRWETKLLAKLYNIDIINWKMINEFVHKHYLMQISIFTSCLTLKYYFFLVRNWKRNGKLI